MVKPPVFCMAGNLQLPDYRPVSDTLHRAEVGRRLRAAIDVLGLSQTAVGKAIGGASPSKMGNWLRGDSYPSEWFIKQFCDRYGITTDWIYRGIVSGMPAELANALWNSEQPATPGQASYLPAAPTRPRKPPPRPKDPAPRPAQGGNVTKNRNRGNGTKSLGPRAPA